MLGPKQGLLGPQDSVMQAGVQEGMPPEAAMGEEAAPTEPAQDAGTQEFEGIVQSIQTLQAGVQTVLDSMLDMEAQSVSDPEGIATFLEDMGMLLAKYQGGGEAAPAEAPMPVEG